jgi:hypothetical protein
MTVSYFDSAFGFETLCTDIANLDESIELVAVLNPKGRAVEIKVKEEGIERDLTPIKREMFFMQCVLQSSMNKDQDEEFGRIKSSVFERERFTIFSFGYFNYVIVIVSRPILNTTQLKDSISEKIVNIKKIELLQ